MRVALIADLHGNLIALEAALADIRQQHVDQIVCLGDVYGLGPQPCEVLHTLRELGCPVVMGNADEFAFTMGTHPGLSPNATEFERILYEGERWCAEQLSPEDIAFVRTFQPTVEVSLGHDASLLCFHGSPRSAWEEIRVTMPDDELAEKLGERRTLVMAYGHVHEQMIRRYRQTWLVNPGSVGLAYEFLDDGTDRNPPWAEYGLVTYHEGFLSIDLRRVPANAVAMRQALLTSGMPHAEWWAADRK